jgi:hypothetical protein
MERHSADHAVIIHALEQIEHYFLAFPIDCGAGAGVNLYL